MHGRHGNRETPPLILRRLLTFSEFRSFPGEPVFELKYVDGKDENLHILQIKHAPWLDNITIYVLCENGACDIRGVFTQSNSTLVPRKVYLLYRLGDGVWHAIQVQRG